MIAARGRGTCKAEGVRTARGALVALLLLPSGDLAGATVAVRHPEGTVRGFLSLRASDGRILADGDWIQSVETAGVVKARLVLSFRDGSFHEETTRFTQEKVFRLLTDRVVQKGPSFPRDSDVAVDAKNGHVRVRLRERDGEEKAYDDRLELPPDLANGLVLILLKNLPDGTREIALPMVAAAPKPTLVSLRVTRAGDARVQHGARVRKAARHRVKVEIGGIKGFLARLLKKLPPDTFVDILEGEAPTFVRSEGPIFQGGPVWRLELSSPVPSDNPLPAP